MNRYYAKTKRQFNYLVKQVTQLMDSEKWEELSENQKNKIVIRFNRLYNKLKAVFNKQSLVKAMGAAALVLGMGITANAQSFKPLVNNPFGITVNADSLLVVPTYADIDDDGDLDMFDIELSYSGYYYSAKVLYIENTGTATAPSFGSKQLNPFGLTTDSLGLKNTFVDIDGDGDLDLFRGGRFMLYYYQNTGTKSAPQFGAMVINPFNIGSSALFPMPEFADIDDDGDMDLMVGGYSGDMFYLQNTGSKTAPNFAPSITNPFGITNAGVDLIAPEFSDVDGDGDLDIMTSEYYGTFIYYKNIGTKSSPAFAAPLTNPFGLTTIPSSYSTFATFADLDNDGDEDIMVGDYYGTYYYYENASGIGLEEFTLNAEVKLFPNPATEEVNITLEEQYQNVEIELSSLSGQLVLQKNFVSSEDITLNVADLESGVYFVKITTENKIGLKKLMIE